MSVSEGDLGGCENWNEPEIWWRYSAMKVPIQDTERARFRQILTVAKDLLATESTENDAGSETKRSTFNLTVGTHNLHSECHQLCGRVVSTSEGTTSATVNIRRSSRRHPPRALPKIFWRSAPQAALPNSTYGETRLIVCSSGSCPQSPLVRGNTGGSTPPWVYDMGPITSSSYST